MLECSKELGTSFQEFFSLNLTKFLISLSLYCSYADEYGGYGVGGGRFDRGGRQGGGRGFNNRGGDRGFDDRGPRGNNGGNFRDPVSRRNNIF